MKTADVMKELKNMGNEKTEEIYRRHGAKGELFGVSFANLKKIKRKTKTNHLLAQRLWNTGNLDARTLATLVADPKKADAKMLDKWAKEANYYPLVDYFVREFASKTDLALKKMRKWTKAKNEWVGRAGWMMLAVLALHDPDLDEKELEEYLKRIEAEIHTAKNRTREAMNNALISIGSRSAALEKKAVAAAKRIGKVEVDHGETGCVTPDAVEYIRRTRAREKARKEGPKDNDHKGGKGRRGPRGRPFRRR